MVLPDEDDAARRYARLVARCIRPYYLQGGGYDDLFQEGMIGLLLALRRYDPARSDCFELYAARCIRTHAIDAVRRGAAWNRQQQALLTLSLPAQRFDPETEVLSQESANEIHAALSGLLSAFEASVLAPYLEGYSTPDIAALLGRPVKSVENAVQRIRRKLTLYLQGRQQA